MSQYGSLARILDYVETEEVPLEFVVADVPVPGVGDLVKTVNGSYGRIIAEKMVNGVVGYSIRLLADMKTWWQETRFTAFCWASEVVLL